MDDLHGHGPFVAGELMRKYILIKPLILLGLCSPFVQAEDCAVRPRVNGDLVIEDANAKRDIVYLYSSNKKKAAEILCEDNKKMTEKLWSPNEAYLGLTKFEYQADFTYYRIEHNPSDKVIRKKLIDQTSGNLLQVEVYNPETANLAYINYYDGVNNTPVKRDYFNIEGGFTHSSEFFFEEDKLVKFTCSDSDGVSFRSYNLADFKNAELIENYFSKNINNQFTTIIYDTGFDLFHEALKNKIHSVKKDGKIQLGLSLKEENSLPFETPKLGKNSDPKSSGTAFLSLAMKGINSHSAFPVSQSENSTDIGKLKNILVNLKVDIISINLQKKKRSESDKEIILNSLNSLIAQNLNTIIVLNQEASKFLKSSYSHVITTGVFTCDLDNCSQVNGVENPGFALLEKEVSVSQMGGGERHVMVSKVATAAIVNKLQKLRAVNQLLNSTDLIEKLKEEVVVNIKIQAQTGGHLPLGN